MSIVIVEGPDGSGKTTLLRNLREQSRNYFWIASSSGRPRTLFQLEQALHWLGQALYLGIPIVCDRFPLLSEEVYGPILRGASLLDRLSTGSKEEYAHLLAQVKRVIYCRPPTRVIVQNLKSNPQLEGVRDKISRIIMQYDDIIGSITDTVPVVSYDYTANYSQSLDSLFFGEIHNG